MIPKASGAGMDIFAGTSYHHRYVVPGSDPRLTYGTGACLLDELPLAAKIRAVSCLPVTPGGRAPVFRTPCNVVGHRVRISGANRHERERFARMLTGVNSPGRC